MDPELLAVIAADDAALAQTVLDLDAPVRELLARLHADDVAWLDALHAGLPPDVQG